MKFELCAASIEAVKKAGEIGFDRIELCQALEQGGLTPSAGMIEFALASGIETHVLIRPRPGGFFYSEDEIEIIYREIINCKRLGVKGIVVGVLSETGEIDKVILNKMVDLSGGMEITVHRAFDDSIDWKKSIDILIESRVTRVLSSGMASSVDVGMPILKEMVEYAADRIEVMTGGGVHAGNIKRIMHEVKPAAIHFSATVKHQLDENSLFSESILKFEAEKAKKMLSASIL